MGKICETPWLRVRAYKVVENNMEGIGICSLDILRRWFDLPESVRQVKFTAYDRPGKRRLKCIIGRRGAVIEVAPVLGSKAYDLDPVEFYEYHRARYVKKLSARCGKYIYVECWYR